MTYDLRNSPGYRLSLLARLIEKRFEEALGPLDLNRMSWAVLVALGEEDLRHPSQVAAFLRVDRAAVSRTLSNLETRGLIQRENGTEDGRTRTLALTKKGQDLLTRSIPLAEENASHFLDKMTRYEADMLSRMIDNLMDGEGAPVRNL